MPKYAKTLKIIDIVGVNSEPWKFISNRVLKEKQL